MTYGIIEPSELDIEASFSVSAGLQPTADDLAHLESEHNRKYNPHLQDPNNPIRRRIIIERAIVRRAVTDLIAAGHVLRVHYGDEEYGCEPTDDVAEVMGAIGACDEEELFVFQRGERVRHIGAVLLVYGNSGWDVLAEYNMNLQIALKGADQLADELSQVAA